MIIDITDRVLADFDNTGRCRSQPSTKQQMMSWLEQNVGLYDQESTANNPNPREYCGIGWKWGACCQPNTELIQTKWHVNIDNEQLATMFSLRFL